MTEAPPGPWTLGLGVDPAPSLLGPRQEGRRVRGREGTESVTGGLFLKNPWRPFSMQTTNSFVWSYLRPRPAPWTWNWQSPLPRPAGLLLAPKQPSPRSLNLDQRIWNAECPACDWGQMWFLGQALHFSDSWFPWLKNGEKHPCPTYCLGPVGGSSNEHCKKINK